MIIQHKKKQAFRMEGEERYNIRIQCYKQVPQEGIGAQLADS